MASLLNMSGGSLLNKVYRPYDYSLDYLTFVAKENGTFTFTPKNNNVISYSTDDGNTWTVGNSVQVNSGDKVMWKGIMTPQVNQGIGTFTASTNSFDVQGNIMSLLYGDNFKNKINLTRKNAEFSNLFVGTKVVNAENLILPATALTTFCYYCMFANCTKLIAAPKLPATTLVPLCYTAMFYNCTNLTVAPELPAITLEQQCYYNMFNGCTKLSSITCLATNISASDCTKNWVSGVVASGTFVKAASMNSWTTGNSGIPNGWTVVQASD